MNKSTEEVECTAEIVGTPSRKKLKQAQLPFQPLNSPESTQIGLSKKRRLSTLQPTNCSSEKIAKKDNTLRKQDEIVVVQKSDKNNAQKVADESLKNSKKGDKTTVVKPNALTRFLQKAADLTLSVETYKSDKSNPVVVLNRCDDDIKKRENKSADSDSLNDSITRSVNKIDSSEIHELKNENDSSLDSIKKEDTTDKKSIVICSDDATANSDSESDTFSSEDDNDDEDDGDGDDDKSKERSDNDTERMHQGDNDNSEGVPIHNKIESKTDLKKKKLTPRQLEKKAEMIKKLEERQKLRVERERQRIEKRMKRQQEKEAEKEQKRKEREQKELKKQLEIEQKQREKERKEKAKEEDRRKREKAKEEEKRRKEEEKLELERKNQKVVSTFASFFVTKKQETKSTVEDKVIGACNFMPFEIKADMKMAPICRRSLNDVEKLQLDSVCLNSAISSSQLYLDEIKNNTSVIRKSEKTWLPAEKDAVVILEDDEIDSSNIVDQASGLTEKHRPKLLSFSENRRPPYWGTWRKKSNIINSRRPFSKDSKWFDYEIDSDEEWEEEEPGESLRGSDDEKDEENPDDNEYDVDNEFMVPHGYLSDEEARGDEDEENMSPEKQKFKLKVLGEQFEAEMNEKTAKIKPKVIGCIWQNPQSSYPENMSENAVKILTERQVWVSETPIILASKSDDEMTKNSDASTLPKKQSLGTKKTKVPEEALPDLIRLIHGNRLGRPFLIKEFITYWQRKNPECRQRLSKISVAQKIQELAKRMACPEEGPMHMKTCWYVSEEIRKKYLDENLLLPNKWQYVFNPELNTTTEITKLIKKIEKDKELHDRDKKKECKDEDKDEKGCSTDATGHRST